MIRLINIGLLFVFSICYLEWGGGNSSFMFRMEYELFNKKTGLVEIFTHPLIITGFTGQIFLLISAIRKVPNRKLNLAGLILLGVIVLLVLLAGLLSLNFRIIGSTLPFIILSIFYFKAIREKT